MASEHESDTERRSRTREVIDHMLEERQVMLVLFERVAGIEPYSHDMPSAELLQEFSQVLVDYIAADHFSLYERITEGKERRQKLFQLAEQLYAEIAETTETAVSFNDRIEKLVADGDQEAVKTALSELGERLAVRIELEDRLLERMLFR